MDKGRLKPGENFLGVPMYSSISAGPASTEEEILLDHVDLNDYLIPKPSTTVLLGVRGDSMIDAGIYEGDKDQTKSGRPVLQPGNKNYEPIVPQGELRIFGKVVGVIRKM
jgi:repressor LexA